MKSIEKQIQQIKQIRFLRVQTSMQEQAKCMQEVQLLDASIEKARRNIQLEEQRAITFQRDGLSRLLGGSLVGVESLKEFNSRKLQGIRSVADAKQEVVEISNAKATALKQLSVRARASKLAEKRLIGIEEVITKELWK